MLRVTSYAFQVIKYLFEIAEDAISQTGGLYFDRRYAYNALARKEYLARKRIKHPPKQISDTIRYLKEADKRRASKNMQSFWNTGYGYFTGG